MKFDHEGVQRVYDVLAADRDKKTPQQLLRSPAFAALFEQIKLLPAEQRGSFGKEVNALKQEVESWALSSEEADVIGECPHHVAPELPLQIRQIGFRILLV
jgi:hypothetical protein